MRVVSVREMQWAEQEANRQGLTYDAMMENAGRAVADAVAAAARSSLERVLVLVGPGNNGGDGLVAARYLCEWGHRTSVYLWKRAGREDDVNLVRLAGLPVTIWRADEDAEGAALLRLLRGHDIWVDALLGTGAKGPLRDPLPRMLGQARAVLQRLRGGTPPPDESKRPLLVAVDAPSGMDCDTGAADEAVLPADLTITFAYPKVGHYRFPGASLVGRLCVADIGLPTGLAADGLQVADEAMVASRLPSRPLDGHKGTFGTVLVIAGSRYYCGAPRLSALACARSGAGLVRLAIPEGIYAAAAGSVMEPTLLPLPDDGQGFAVSGAELVAEVLGDVDVALVGPGLGQSAERGLFVRRVLALCKEHETRLVLDADGLNLLAEYERWWRDLPPETILTPHPGEMARLVGRSVVEVQEDRVALARDAARRWGCTVLLKGAFSVIADVQQESVILPFANPALASGGTGDVLAGAIAGIWAQKKDRYAAALCGAYLHGLAAETLSSKCGNAGLLAGDLLTEIPAARAALVEARREAS